MGLLFCLAMFSWHGQENGGGRGGGEVGGWVKGAGKLCGPAPTNIGVCILSP